MTFLDVVNRIFVINAIIRGDTDAITSFSDTQHGAAIDVAQVAVTDELINLVSNRCIPKERSTSGSITLTTNTRVYNLATNFIRFYGVPHFYNSTENRQIYEYQGGVKKLQIDIYNYATQYGSPNWFYWEPGDTTYKQVGFFLVPSSEESGDVWTYDYEASVIVSSSGDNLPFHNTEENYAFAGMCARRFKFMFEDVKNQADIMAILDKDQTYKTYKSNLLNLIRGKDHPKRYGNVYE